MGCHQSGVPGSLWSTNDDLALAISASMPSGCDRIVRIRKRLFDACDLSVPAVFRPSSFPVCIFSGSLLVPVNAGFCDGQVYIGSGNDSDICKTGASPWGSPFGCSAVGDYALLFADYAKSRADADVWLAPLVGKKLVCECDTKNKSKNTHCMVIAQLIYDVFPTEPQLPVHVASPFDCVDDARFSFSSTYGVKSGLPDDCSQFDWGAIESICQHPKVLSWPEVWGSMVSSIRESTALLFWELFAGSGACSKAFSEADWICGPPVDFRITPDYDLLNPRFVAVVIGLILEGRFAIIHLAPPYFCAGSSFKSFATVCEHIITACMRVGCNVHLVMPAVAAEWNNSTIASCVSSSLHGQAFVDTCMCGSPWSVKVRISGSYSGLSSLQVQCCCSSPHVPLHSKSVVENEVFTSGRLWPLFAKQLAEAYEPLRGLVRLKDVSHLAGL